MMTQFIFYMGVTDAGLIMAGGAASAFVVLMGWDAKALWERIWPATLCLVGSNIAAAIILWLLVKITQ